MFIHSLYSDETALYAAEELKKYLDIMNPGFCEGIVSDAAEIPLSNKIRLGLLDDFGFDSSDVIDVTCDDVIYIDINSGSGIIAGSNIRSILLSVYAYLRAAGCAFIRPGKDGEVIPSKNMSDFSYTYRKKADYPFRGECIEGAVSYEHVCETIIWSPKVGMNMFMIQQIIPYNFMSRWYKHTSNTVEADENVSYDEVGEYIQKIELLIKKCGLQFHALGHGYLLEPYGIHYKTINDKYELNDEARKDIAIVKGKRELFLGSPNFTHLCYSDKCIRKKLVDWLIEYVRKKPYIDFLHVWLADSFNNQCECKNCINERISDLYVKLLNELDEELTRLSIDTKIVFILYVDTLWAPLYEKIKNPDRFYMMTAIGGRDYTKSYDKTPYDNPMPPYIKNDYKVEQSFPLRMRFIDDWKPFFDGRKFVYEYHMYVNQYNDPGFMSLSKSWLEDVKNLSEFEFHGLMSDQTQRSFFPNGLPMCIYAAAMFDKKIDFDSFVSEYMQLSYGEDYILALNYLSAISDLMGPDIFKIDLSIVDLDGDLKSKKTISNKRWVDNEDAHHNFKAVIDLCNDFENIAYSHLSSKNMTLKKSWLLLYYHTDFCRRYAGIFLEHSLGNNEKAHLLLDEMIDVFSKTEHEISYEFDLFLFKMSVDRKLK